MRITQGEIVDLQTVLHIEMEDADVRPYLDSGYQKVRPYVAYPGFRKGRVPRHIVMQFLGREALLQEVLETLTVEVTTKAMTEQAIEPGGIPDIEVLTLDPVTIKATVPLMPEVDLGDYRDIRVDVERREVGEDDVQERLEQIRNSMASWEPVERAVAMGDMVTMTATGAVDGASVLDETDTVYLLVEDADRPFPGFAEALVGSELDAPREFELTVADDFPDDAVAGKPVQVSVTVSDIKERILPDMDDDFAQTVGGEGEFETLDDIREQIADEMRSENENATERELRESAVSSLIEGVDVAIAPVMIEQEMDYMLNEQAQTLARMNIRYDDYLRSIGSSADEARSQIRDAAIERITRAVALEKLGVAEGISVSPDEIEQHIENVIDANIEDGADRPEITDDMRNNVRRMLQSEKVMARLVEIAKGEVSGAAGDGAAADDVSDDAAAGDDETADAAVAEVDAASDDDVDAAAAEVDAAGDGDADAAADAEGGDGETDGEKA